MNVIDVKKLEKEKTMKIIECMCEACQAERKLVEAMKLKNDTVA